MKKIAFVPLCLWLAACSFNPSGLGATAPDSGDDLADAGNDADGADSDVSIDADPGIDAAPPPDATVCPADQVLTDDGCQPYPTITCSLHSGTEMRLRFEGYVAAGFLGTAPSGATPVAIQYGSDFDSAAIMSACDDGERWTVPYPSDCSTKPLAAWSGGDPATVDLVISKTAENINVALVYDDGTVRWGDLTASDGDPDGFVVSGSGSGYSCHIQHVGNGGIIKIAP